MPNSRICSQLIEYLDARDADAVADLLSCYQVQHSRLSGELAVFNTPVHLNRYHVLTEDNISSTITESVRLRLLATSMFDFARRKTEHIGAQEFAADEVEKALMGLGIFDLVSEEFRRELIDELSAKDRPAMAS